MANTKANISDIDGEVPNAETIAAIEEVQKMKSDPSICKTYSSIDELIEELFAAETVD